MNYKIDNSRNEMQRAKTIIIYIGFDRYRLNESDDGKLIINKMSDDITDDIRVYPIASNVIRID